MKKIIRYTLGLFVATFMMFGCKQQDAEMYENNPQLFFARGNDGYGQQDSIIHSFFLVAEGQDRDTVYVELATMGFPENITRPVNIVQTNTGEVNAAIAGTHYIAFDDPSIADQFAVAAGKVSVKIPVIFFT